MITDQAAQAVIAEQGGAAAEETRRKAYRIWLEHIAGAQRSPHRGQVVDGVPVGPAAGEVGGVERPGGCADQQVRCDASIGECREHADLHRPEACAA